MSIDAEGLRAFLDRLPTLTIDEVVHRCGVSPAAIRRYEMAGLLPAAEPDLRPGQHLYTPAQVESIRLISLLRQLDMPLATVGEVLADDDPVARLDAWSANKAGLGGIEYLRAMIGGDEPGYPVTVTEAAAATVAGVVREVDQSDLAAVVATTVEEIRRHLAEVGATLTPQWWVRYHGFITPDSRARIEVCVPFIGEADSCLDIEVNRLPVHAEAACVIPRDDCHEPAAMVGFDALRWWFTQSGRAASGPMREIRPTEGSDGSVVRASQPLVVSRRHGALSRVHTKIRS